MKTRGGTEMSTAMLRTAATLLAVLCLSFQTPGGDVREDDSAIEIGICITTDDLAEEVQINGLDGALAKIREINEKDGGVNGRPIRPIIIRPANDTDSIRMAVGQMLSRHNIAAMLALSSSDALDGIRRAFDEAGAVMCVFPLSLDAGLDQAGEAFLRLQPDSDRQAEALTRYLRKIDLVTLAVVYDSRYTAQLAMARAVADRHSQAGGDVVSIQSYDNGVVMGDEDFSAQLLEVKRVNPDAVAVIGHPEEVAAIVRQANDLGITARFCGGTTWNNGLLFSAGGTSLERSFFISLFQPDEGDPLADRFSQTMFEGGAEYLGGDSAACYDAVHLLAAALGSGKPPAELPAEVRRLVSTLPMVTGPAVVSPKNNRVVKLMRIHEVAFDRLEPKLRLLATIPPTLGTLELVLAEP